KWNLESGRCVSWSHRSVSHVLSSDRRRGSHQGYPQEYRYAGAFYRFRQPYHRAIEGDVGEIGERTRQDGHNSLRARHRIVTVAGAAALVRSSRHGEHLQLHDGHNHAGFWLAIWRFSTHYNVLVALTGEHRTSG